MNLKLHGLQNVCYTLNIKPLNALAVTLDIKEIHLAEVIKWLTGPQGTSKGESEAHFCCCSI